VKIGLGQINPTVGEFEGNGRLIEDALAAAERGGADLLVLPELALCGYPPKDLLERSAFLDAARVSLERLSRRVGPRTALLVGFPDRLPDVPTGRRVANAAALIEAGRVLSIHHKSLLPTYDVFDEWRYFEPAAAIGPAELRGRRLGISICEDIWNDADFWPRRLYRDDPVERLVAAGAEIIINISASPFAIEKRRLRPEMLAATARRWRRPLVFVNAVGGQDDIVFDGASLGFASDGTVIARGAENAPDFLMVDLDTGVGDLRDSAPSDERAALAALTLGTADYARRCGFRRAILGLSGGIDSALVACIAVEALGAANVLAVFMPSRFTSDVSRRDATDLARNLGIALKTISIEPMLEAYLASLAPAFEGRAADVTEENLQARIRGAILMALSNKHGHLLLTTGNKSELATGYCTLYGDMAGGLAVISDVPKTLVYDLAREVNRARVVIPESTLTRAPSAELRPGQTDQDVLPPYPLLDAILEAHLGRNLDAEALVSAGFPPAIVADVLARVRLSEYKRRQMPPGLKITGKAFGPGRRIPIAHAWRG